MRAWPPEPISKVSTHDSGRTQPDGSLLLTAYTSIECGSITRHSRLSSFPRGLSPPPIGVQESRLNNPSFPRRLSPPPIGGRESRLNNPSFPRKRESRTVGSWRTQLYETSSSAGGPGRAKWAKNGCETSERGSIGGFLPKIFDIKSRKFATMTCTHRKFTAIYAKAHKVDSNPLGDKFDLFT